jgi:hypothetical protein
MLGVHMRVFESLGLLFCQLKYPFRAVRKAFVHSFAPVSRGCLGANSSSLFIWE